MSPLPGAGTCNSFLPKCRRYSRASAMFSNPSLELWSIKTYAWLKLVRNSAMRA